jgi:Protein of unknown function (DUF1329)
MNGRRVFLVVLAMSLATTALAQPKPGETITGADADRVKDFVSPGVEWLVRRGMTMKIVAYQKTDDPPAFKAATEKYAGQTKLRADGLIDESTYVAGRPFPTIDANDPQAAIKIMYNYERSRYATDDLTTKFLDAETGVIDAKGAKQRFAIERHFVVGALRLLKYIGRTENPPIPALPNPSGFLIKAGQYPILEPFDLKGVGGLVYRYLDPTKLEETWMYMPSLRRVKRISTAQRSTALYGQDVDVDSYGGFAGQIPSFEWKLLGEKRMFAAGHCANLPPEPCKDDGGVSFCDNWELVPRVYVVEGRSRAAGYAYSKRVIFVDAETSYIPYTDLYDAAGQLWRVAVNYGRYSTKPNPRASLSYPFPRGYLPGFVMADIQLSHATRAALPGIGFPDEAGWYVNEGDTDDAWFSIGALIAAGR